jgi:hypothetical protein
MKISTLKFPLLFGLLFSASLSMAQTAATYTTVGIIGSATAKGWTESTPMQLVSAADVHNWKISLPLTVGAVKFRANDAWTVNWGGGNLPAGTGAQDGADIPVTTAGQYNVTFNDVTGAYTFTATTATASKSASASLLKLALAPNPTKESMRVAYDLPTASAVTVTIQNQLGQTMRQFPSVRQGAGRQEQQLSLNGLASGLYLVQLKTGTQTQAARLVVE